MHGLGFRVLGGFVFRGLGFGLLVGGGVSLMGFLKTKFMCFFGMGGGGVTHGWLLLSLDGGLKDIG